MRREGVDKFVDSRAFLRTDVRLSRDKDGYRQSGIERGRAARDVCSVDDDGPRGTEDHVLRVKVQVQEPIPLTSRRQPVRTGDPVQAAVKVGELRRHVGQAPPCSSVSASSRTLGSTRKANTVSNTSNIVCRRRRSITASLPSRLSGDWWGGGPARARRQAMPAIVAPAAVSSSDGEHRARGRTRASR